MCMTRALYDSYQHSVNAAIPLIGQCTNNIPPFTCMAIMSSSSGHTENMEEELHTTSHVYWLLQITFTAANTKLLSMQNLNIIAAKSCHNYLTQAS